MEATRSITSSGFEFSPAVSVATTSAATNKRRNGSHDLPEAESEEAEGDARPRRQRSFKPRAKYSCTECVKKKTKCDREMPCGSCKSRRIVNRCAYSDLPLGSSDNTQERFAALELRLASVEAQLRENSQTEPAGHVRITAQPSQALRPPAEQSTYRALPAVNKAGFFYRENACEVNNQSPKASQTEAQIDHFTFVNSGGNTAPKSAGTSVAQLSRLTAVLAELPSRSSADSLVSSYFLHINANRHPIDETLFRQSYRFLWSLGPPDIISTLDVLKIIPLVFAIFAISVPALPADAALLAEGGKDIAELAHEFHLSSRQAIALIDGFADLHADHSIIMAEVLQCRHLLQRRRASEAPSPLASAVSRAMAAQLHLSSAEIGISAGSVQDVERRLLWHHIYRLDCFCATLLGRPALIDDHYVGNTGPLPPHDASITPLAYFAYRHALARINQQMNSKTIRSRTADYHAVLGLEGELETWKLNLPWELSIRDMNDSLSFRSGTDLQKQTLQLFTDYNFMRITLHRPYFLMALSDRRYQPSREACIASALSDIACRTSPQQRATPSFRPLTGSHLLAISLVILGLALEYPISQGETHQIRASLKALLRAEQLPMLLGEDALRERAREEIRAFKAPSPLVSEVRNSPSYIDPPTNNQPSYPPEIAAATTALDGIFQPWWEAVQANTNVPNLGDADWSVWLQLMHDQIA